MAWNRSNRAADPTIEQRIRHALEEIPGVLRRESLSIELVEFVPATGVAVLRFRGDCPDCDMTAAMFIPGVEAHLRMQVSEIREVRAATDRVSS